MSPGTFWHRGRTIFASLALTNVAINAFCAPGVDQTTDNNTIVSSDVVDLWRKFTAINKVWLDPHPQQLSYVAESTLKNAEEGKTRCVNHVLIDGESARWELESEDPHAIAKHEPAYVLICNDGKVSYLQPPADALLNKPVPRQGLLILRQGICWYTSPQSAYQEGLPRDCRLVGREKVDGGEIVVVEMVFPQRRSSVGLGFFHVFLGQSSTRLERVRLHFRLPECLLVKEELSDQGIIIDYGPEFLAFGEQRAPSRIRYNSRLTDGKPWVLEGQFQNFHGGWILDKAFNIQDGKVISEMHVTDLSSAAVDRSRFNTHTNNPQ